MESQLPTTSEGRLSTWEGLCAVLSELYAATPSTDPLAPGRPGLALRVEPAKAPIIVRPTEVPGQPAAVVWLELSGVLANALRSLPPTPVLQRNFELPIGNFAVVGGALMLRQLLPLSELRLEDLKEAISAIASAIAEAEVK